MDLKDCLTVQEAAIELRRARASLAHWRMAGKGPRFIKDGKNIYYSRAEIERYKRDNIKQFESTAQAKADRKSRGKDA